MRSLQIPVFRFLLDFRFQSPDFEFFGFDSEQLTMGPVSYAYKLTHVDLQLTMEQASVYKHSERASRAALQSFSPIGGSEIQIPHS